jgi:hypothetical protein
MLRLNPAHPPLWRDARTLQFGTSGVARLEEPEPWELRLLADLAGGLSDLALAALLAERGIPRERADALLAEIQPALARERPPARLIVAAGRGLSEALLRRVTAAMTRAGADARAATSAGSPPSALADAVVVLLAAHIVEPRHASALMADDVAHIPLVFDGAGAVVGPLVRPGETACLACDAAAAREADPAWPAVVSQLVGRACDPDPDLATEAARVLVQVVSGADAAANRSVRLRQDDPHRVWRTHRPHPECGCRSLGGSATAIDRSGRDLATSSATAFARPA